MAKVLLGSLIAILVALVALVAFRADAMRFGDADCNGTVNSIDALLILQHDAGLTDFFITPDCAGKADINQDGAVNAIDAALVLQHVARLITLPTPIGTGDDVPTPGPFDFSITGGSASMPEGMVSWTTNASITLTHEAGLPEFVTLTQQSDPPGPSIAFVNPDASPPGFVNGCVPYCYLGVHLGWTGGGAEPGKYSITITGTAGDVVRAAKFTVVVPHTVSETPAP